MPARTNRKVASLSTATTASSLSSSSTTDNTTTNPNSETTNPNRYTTNPNCKQHNNHNRSHNTRNYNTTQTHNTSSTSLPSSYAQHQILRQYNTTSITATTTATTINSITEPSTPDGGSFLSTSSASPRGCSPLAESILKVVLIGDSGVGKSNLVRRFTKNKFKPQSVQTVGFEFATKTIRVGDRRLKAQIWDTAGQERFQALTAAYYRNAVGAMVVYDITNRRSFEHVTGWLAQVQQHAHASSVLVLVGNKCDLAHLPESRQVSTLEAARFAAKHAMAFLETSALDATNVVDAFKKVIVPVGRLLAPAELLPSARLPQGWRRVLSRTRPGEYSYENQYTKERISFAPKEAAKPSQQSFRSSPASGAKSGAVKVVTVTRESLQKQHQKAFLAQNQTPPCGVCASGCTIL